MTEDELRAALTAAGDDDELLRHVIRGCGDCMRKGNDVDRVGLASILLPLAAHPLDKVRQALADVCDAFPDPFFDHALAPLSGDLNHYVRAAAARAAQRRALKRKTIAKEESEERVLGDLLGAIESKPGGKASRRLAERAIRRGVEHVVGRLYHELSKTDDAMESALVALRAELSEPRPSIAALKRHEERLSEKVAFVQAIIRRGRDYAAPTKPAFADEQLASIVGEARTQLFAHLGERARAVDFTTDVDPALRLHADRHALLQVFQNLLQNAVESYPATASAPVRVEARALRSGSEIEVRVIDHGGGMTETVKARLFVPFATAKTGGTGVGLSIVRKMVEEVHSGEVSLETTLGVGTVAKIVLPARQPGVRE